MNKEIRLKDQDKKVLNDFNKKSIGIANETINNSVSPICESALINKNSKKN